MKITKSELKTIIREERARVLEEQTAVAQEAIDVALKAFAAAAKQLETADEAVQKVRETTYSNITKDRMDLVLRLVDDMKIDYSMERILMYLERSKEQ